MENHFRHLYKHFEFTKEIAQTIRLHPAEMNCINPGTVRLRTQSSETGRI